MKNPKPRGSAIDDARIASWLERFKFYRHPPDRTDIHKWLNRFKGADKDLAARMLDVVEIKSEMEIQSGYSAALASLAGWHPDSAKRIGRWLFVGFGGAGESGQSMLRVFREATRMNPERFKDLFCSASDLASKALTAQDTVVFVDDFSGTGQQVTKVWPVLAELIASEAKCHLLLTAATEAAIDEIASKTELIMHASCVLSKTDNLFNAECTHFSKDEKKLVEKYGKIADRNHPRGWGKCGILFVLSHKTPNNTIPILHVNNRKWVGLFPRYLPQPAV
jgi:hypothetical protein